MLNCAVVIGRLTSDPEVRKTQSGVSVCRFTVAVDRNYKQGEERQADFINVVAWNKTGEFCSKYFKKGQQVSIIGRLQTRTWDDDKGTKHYVTEVIAEEAYFADSRRDGDASGFENTFGETLSQSAEFQVTSSDDDLPF